jgi:hypothetical protein
MAAHDYFDQKYADMDIHYTCLNFIGQDKVYYIFNKKIKIGKARSVTVRLIFIYWYVGVVFFHMIMKKMRTAWTMQRCILVLLVKKL